MPIAWLCQIDAVARDGGAASVLRLSSHDDERLCHLDTKVWWPSIARLPTFAYDFFDGAFGGDISAPSGKTDVSLAAVPGLAAAMLHGARIRWWSGELGAAWGSFVLRFDGLIDNQAAIREGVAAIEFRVDDAWLDDPILATFAGTTGAEGEAALKGQVKPLLLGAPRMVEGVLANSIDTMVQLNDGAIAAVEVAMENVDRAFSFSANYASYAALQAATIPPGSYATALAVGWVRHGAPSDGVLTYDVQGSNAGADGGGLVRRTGAIIKRLAARMGKSAKIDSAAMTAIDASRPWNVSVALTAQTTMRELVQSLAQSINAVALVTWTGLLTILPISAPEAAVAAGTLASDGSSLPPVARVDQLAIASPFWRIAIEAAVTNRVHALDEIRFSAPLVPRGRYSASETYREGNIVDLADGSTWLYIATTPGAGNAPPVWPINSNAWWFNLNPPLKASGITYDDGQTVEELQPAEPGATDGATVGENVKDEEGAILSPTDLLNAAITITDKGRLQIAHDESVEVLGQVTSALEYLGGQTMEALKPAEGGSTAGAVIASADYIGPIIGGIRDELGAARAASDMLNTSLILDAAGILSIMRSGGARQELGRVAVDALGAASAAAQRRADEAMDRLAAIVTQIDTRLSTTQTVIRDAGIYVDPASGRVTISAIDATAERISDVSITLDAVQGVLALTASQSYVDNAIATAVLDPSQVPIFTGIEARLTSAEVRLDGAEAALLLKADVAIVTALEASLTTAQVDIDALEGAITTKVDSASFDALETRVAGAESSLAAIGDTASIGRELSVARLVARQQDDEAAASLGAILAGDRRQRDTIAALASASEQITTRLIDGDAAEASARTVLAARVGSAEAAISSEQVARASADTALGQRVDTVEVNLSTETTQRVAAVSSEALARAGADSALGSRVDTVEANLATETGARAAAVSSEATARANADTAIGLRVDAVEATIATETGNLGAAITAEVGARAGADGALAGRIDTVEANLATETTNRTAAVSAEAGARATADGALEATIATKASTTSVDALGTRVSSAETVIASLGDVAGMKRDIVVTRRDAETQAANDLAGILANDAAARRNAQMLASTSEQLTVRLIDGDQAEAASRFELAARVDTAAAGILTEQSARASADDALSTRIDTLTADLTTETGQRIAAVTTEAGARATADTALSGRVDTVEASLSTETTNRQAAVTSEATARANADGALGARIDTVEANLTTETSTRTAAVSSEALARTNADSALGGRIDTVEANLSTEIGARTAAVSSEAGARATADTALGTRIDNVVASVTTEVGARTAAVSNEATARANADGALSTQIGTLTTTVNGHTASISTNASTIDGVRARYTLRLNAGDKVAGMAFGVSGTTSTVDFVTSVFRVSNADGSIANAPFEIRSGAVYMKKALIEDLSVDTIKIAGNAITLPVSVEAGSAFVGPDDGEYNLLETSLLNIGTVGNPASVLLGFYATLRTYNPTGGGPDNAAEFKLYCDKNDGNGYQMVGLQAVGIEVTSGNAYYWIPVSMVDLVSGCVSAKFKITVKAINGPQGRAARISLIGAPTLVVQGSKR